MIKKVAAFHDISGYGKCSLTVAIGVMSALGVQVCPAPTAVLSTITGFFDQYEFVDMTPHLKRYIDCWYKYGIKLDAVYTGFLGSPGQVDIVTDFIDRFNPDLKVIDQVFADDGKTYECFDQSMVRRMRELIGKADVITPNITEAAFLLEKKLPEQITRAELKEWLAELANRGAVSVVITGAAIERDTMATVLFAENRHFGIAHPKIKEIYPGTGDLLASMMTARLLIGCTLVHSVLESVSFVYHVLCKAVEYKIEPRSGLPFELFLNRLDSVPLLDIFEF